MRPIVRVGNWIALGVLVVVYVISLFNLFGPTADKGWPGIALGVLFLVPVPLLIASNLIGQKRPVSSIVALFGVMLVSIDIAISLVFNWNITASWIRWLLESTTLLLAVSLLARRATGTGRRHE